MIPVTRQTHAGKFWKRFTSYAFAAETSLAPLVMAEVVKAVRAFPMGFVKDQGRFLLVAVLSFLPKTNLYVASSGQWMGPYIPSAFRGYPFALAKVQGRNDLALCVDENPDVVSDIEGEPFFGEDGELSPQTRDVLVFLTKIEESRIQTQKTVSALAKHDVVVPWALTVKAGGREKKVDGLYRVDETRLNTLDNEDFLKLRAAGSLPIAFGQILSMDNIQVFDKLLKVREKHAAADQKQPETPPVFGDDDMISFQ